MLTILDGISRFLFYLNISQKYLNRLYTIAASIPIFYIFKLALMFYVEKNTPLFLTNILLFIFFLYFLILNFMYYFLGKNSRFDITQHFAKVLPDEVFLDNTGKLTLGPENVDFIPLELNDEKEFQLFVDSLLVLGHNSDNRGNELTNRGFSLPYYKIQNGRGRMRIFLSIDDGRYREYAHLKTSRSYDDIVGVFLFGGKVDYDGILIKENYRLKLAITKNKKE